MNREEVKQIFKLINSVYPTFDVSSEKIDTWTYLMRKMDFDRVMKKTEEHVASNKFPPTVAEIAAYPPEHNDHLDKMRQWEQEAAQVPDEVKRQFVERMKQLVKDKQQ